MTEKVKWETNTDWGNSVDSDNIEIVQDKFRIDSTIPDEGDLHARYDTTQLSLNDGDAVSTWTDETGNGYDLTAGSAPSYVASGLNGNPIVQFDGSGNYLDAAFTTVSQAFHIFIVVTQRRINTSSSERYMGSADSTNWTFQQLADADDVNMFAGSNFNNSGVADTNAHIYSCLYDGSNTTLRQDGTIIATGNAGTNGMDGLTLGTNNNGDNPAPIDVAECLVYPMDKSGVQSDVESYLADKWGITI